MGNLPRKDWQYSSVRVETLPNEGMLLSLLRQYLDCMIVMLLETINYFYDIIYSWLITNSNNELDMSNSFKSTITLIVQ